MYQREKDGVKAKERIQEMLVMTNRLMPYDEE